MAGYIPLRYRLGGAVTVLEGCILVCHACQSQMTFGGKEMGTSG